jgi:hypothetical protein
VLALEKRLDVQAKCDLDRLACRARWRDDDHTSGWRLRGNERPVIRRERAVLNLSEHASPGCKEEAVANRESISPATASSNLGARARRGELQLVGA